MGRINITYSDFVDLLRSRRVLKQGVFSEKSDERVIEVSLRMYLAGAYPNVSSTIRKQPSDPCLLWNTNASLGQ